MEVEKGLEDVYLVIVVLMLHADIRQLPAIRQTLGRNSRSFPFELSCYKTGGGEGLWLRLTVFNVCPQVSKNKQEHAFFSLPEFERWRAETENAHTWKVKYYKGLGTSTGKEAKEYFSDMDRHRIPFKYAGAEDDDAILLVSWREIR